MSFNEFIGEREREIKAEVNRLKKENTILKKQIPTRERIIGVFRKHFNLGGLGFYENSMIEKFNKIASEILGEEEDE